MNIRDFPHALLQAARIEAAKCKTTLWEFVIVAVKKSVDDKQLGVLSEPQTDGPASGSESDESEKRPVCGDVASLQTEPAAVTFVSDPRVPPGSRLGREQSEKPAAVGDVRTGEMWEPIPRPGGNVAVLVEIPESYYLGLLSEAEAQRQTFAEYYRDLTMRAAENQWY